MDGPIPQFNGNFTESTLPPFNVSSGSAISLSTSYLPIIPTGNLPWLTADFWTPGRLLYIRHMFQCTSAATPGAFFVQLYFGSTNAAGNGQAVVSAGLNWTANNANVTSVVDLWVRCRTVGTTGSILAYGTLFIGGVGLLPVPWNTPGGTTIDTTQEGYCVPQYARNGSTAETITHHDVHYRVMN